MSATQQGSSGYITRAPRSSGLADVLEILLDRGLVLDAFVRVSLLGIELLTVDLRVVIASVDTYLRFAEAVNRLDLQATNDSWSLGRLGEEEEELAESAGKGAVEGGIEGLKEKVTPGGRRRSND